MLPTLVSTTKKILKILGYIVLGILLILIAYIAIGFVPFPRQIKDASVYFKDIYGNPIKNIEVHIKDNLGNHNFMDGGYTYVVPDPSTYITDDKGSIFVPGNIIFNRNRVSRFITDEINDYIPEDWMTIGNDDSPFTFFLLSKKMTLKDCEKVPERKKEVCSAVLKQYEYYSKNH